MTLNVGSDGSDLAMTTYDSKEYQWVLASWWEEVGSTPEVTTLASPFPVQPGTGVTFACTQSGTWNITNISGTVSLPTGAATAANQSTANTALAAIQTALEGTLSVGSHAVTGPLTDAELRATAVPVSGTFWQATQPVSAASLPLPSGASTEATLLTLNGKVTACNTGAVTIAASTGTISTNNSSTTPLGIDAAFTGTADDVKDYSSVTVNVFADQASATDGLAIQWSSNGTNWDIASEAFTVTASTGRSFRFSPLARYLRIIYTNGGTGQGAFRLQTILHPREPATI
jgi:hypothetical protein